MIPRRAFQGHSLKASSTFPKTSVRGRVFFFFSPSDKMSLATWGLMMAAAMIFQTPMLPALAPLSQYHSHGQHSLLLHFAHRPWWHTRGHLSDYATCRPREDDAASSLQKIIVEEHDDTLVVKPSQYREEFINMVNQVPELAALFVPEDMQAEIIPAGQTSTLPLELHPGSLYRHLSSIYRHRISGCRAARDSAAVTETSVSIGYEMQRVWLDAMFSDLGGARGYTNVQRGLRNVQRYTALPGSHDDETEVSHFYLPDFLVADLQLQVKPHMSDEAHRNNRDRQKSLHVRSRYGGAHAVQGAEGCQQHAGDRDREREVVGVSDTPDTHLPSFSTSKLKEGKSKPKSKSRKKSTL